MSIEQKDSFTLQAEFSYLVVFTAGLLSSSREINLKDLERSMEFIRFLHIFKWHRGDEIRLKHYAGILVIEFQADLIYEYDMDTEKAAACLPVTRPLTLSTRSAEGKMKRPARSAFHDLYKIYQVLSLHIPQWSSNDALIVWRNVSGRFLGPIK